MHPPNLHGKTDMFPSSFLLLVVRPGAPSSFLLLLVRHLLLLAWHLLATKLQSSRHRSNGVCRRDAQVTGRRRRRARAEFEKARRWRFVRFYMNQSDGLQPNSNGLQPTSDGLRPKRERERSKRLKTNLDMCRTVFTALGCLSAFCSVVFRCFIACLISFDV